MMGPSGEGLDSIHGSTTNRREESSATTATGGGAAGSPTERRAASATTPRAYKWRQPSDEDENSSRGEAKINTPSWSPQKKKKTSNVSPTDVRQFPYPLSPHSEMSMASSASASASASNNSASAASHSNSNSTSNASSSTPTGPSISTSLATAAAHDDDLSSIDSKSPLVHLSHVYSNPHNNPLTLKTALPPLGTDSDEDDDEHDMMDGHFISIFAASRSNNGTPSSSSSPGSKSTASTITEKKKRLQQNSHNNNKSLLSHPPHPQQEEQHPSKKVEAEVDPHPSKKLDPKPQQLQQPVHHWQQEQQQQHSPNTNVDTKNYSDYLAFVHNPTTNNHQNDETPIVKRRNSSRIQQTVALYERCLPDTTLRFSQPLSGGEGAAATTQVADDNHRKSGSLIAGTWTDSPRKSGSLVAGTWTDSPSQLEFHNNGGDEDNHSITTAATTAAETIISGNTANHNSSNITHNSINNSPCNEIRVEPRRPSSEGVRLSGNWRDDLQATRLDFVADHHRDSTNEHDVSDRSGQEEEEDHGEIQVAPRKSKPVVFRGDLKEYIGSTDLTFRSKEALNFLTPQESAESQSSSVALGSSASPQRATPQRKSLPRHHDITVEPLLCSSPSSHCGNVDAVAAKESFQKPLDDNEFEIKVDPRRSKPLVLKGDLKEYMQNAKLTYQSTRDGLNAISPSSTQQSLSRGPTNSNDSGSSVGEIFLPPRQSEPIILDGNSSSHLQMQMSDDFDDDVEKEEATGIDQNDISVKPRLSKPLVLRGNLKEYMHNAELLYQSTKDDLSAIPQVQQKQKAQPEIMVDPRLSENPVLSGDVSDIMPIDDPDEIKLGPRLSKPTVLRGNLKDYLKAADLVLESNKDLDISNKMAQGEIIVDPLQSEEIRRVVSEDVSDIMPFDDQDSEIKVEARKSKPLVLRGDLKDYLDSTDLFFQSDYDLAAWKQRGVSSRDNVSTKEIVVEPRGGETSVVSGELKDYVQHAAKVFHDSIRDSTLVYHDTIEATKSDIEGVDDDDDDDDEDAAALNTSIDSLKEELALADQSFDLEKSAGSIMSEETMPTANVSGPDYASLTQTPENETKYHVSPIHLPFPWDTPKLLFVPHDELNVPPERIKYYLSPQRLAEKLRQQFFPKVQDSPHCEPQEIESNLLPPTLGSPNIKSDDLPSPEPPPSSSDCRHCKNSIPSRNGRNEPSAVSPDDIAIIYRGEKQPPTSRRKSQSFLATLMNTLSSHHSSSMCDYFCVDCGGPIARCYCEAAVEDDRYRELRMEAVYSIDVGNIVSDSSAKFIVVKPSDTAKKKSKSKKKKQKSGDHALNTTDPSLKQPPTSIPPRQKIKGRSEPVPEPPDPATEKGPATSSLTLEERNSLVPEPPGSESKMAPLRASDKNVPGPKPPDTMSSVSVPSLPDANPAIDDAGRVQERSQDASESSASPSSSSSTGDPELLTGLKIGKSVGGDGIIQDPPPRRNRLKKKKILRGFRKRLGRMMKRIGGTTKASF